MISYKISDEDLFSSDTIENIVLHPMTSGVLEIDSLFLARPTSISYYKDDFLLINDVAFSKQLLVVDLKDNSCKRYIDKGRADNELLRLWDVVAYKDYIFLSSLQEMKGLIMTYDEETRSFVFSKSINFPQQFLHCTPINKGYLTFASASSRNRFVRWSENIVPIDSIGSFPSEGVKNLKNANNAALQSDFTISKDGSRMVVSYKNIDYIDLYEGEVMLRRIRGPKNYEVAVYNQEINGGHMSYVSPVNFAYRSICSTESGFWAGYIGLKAQEGLIPTPDMNRIRKVFQFDWDGNLQTIYQFDQPIEAFTVDERSEMIYCLVCDPEPVILTYRI